MITSRCDDVIDTDVRLPRTPVGDSPSRWSIAALSDLEPASNDPQSQRCRRFVGNRARARNGECGLAAKVILDGQPLCYVHTPVAYRRELAARASGRSRPARGGAAS